MVDEVGAVRTTEDLIRAAHRRLDPAVWDYLMGGAESETTIARNRMALDSYELLPRVLQDVSKIETSGEMLGQPVTLPVFLAPIGSLALFDRDAALASASAAAAFGIPFFMSIMAQPRFEEVARAVPKASLVMQIYVRGGPDWLDETVRRAEAIGCAAICITVDAAVYGRRERDLRNRFSSAAAVDRVNFDGNAALQIAPEQAALSWSTIERLRARTALPMILKGILLPEDARRAADAGIDVVYVSNHGGRQLDHAPGTLDQLAEVVAAVGKRCRIFIDGGFVRGVDIIKARALGADAIGLGKIQGLALAAGGSAGLGRLLGILREEVTTALALLGCASLSGLGPEHLRRAAPVFPPSFLSPFAGLRGAGISFPPEAGGQTALSLPH